MTVGAYLTERWLPAAETTVRSTTFAGYARHVHLALRTGGCL